MSILHQLAESGDNLERLRELLEAGGDPNSRELGGNTPLHVASLKVVTDDELEGNLQVARELVRFGARVNVQNLEGYTPLHFAVGSQKPEMVRFLLQVNAETNIQNRFMQTPLMLAAQYQNVHIVNELLRQHASVNLQDGIGLSALHYALIYPRVEPELVEELLRHKCDHIIINSAQRMPLDLYLRNLAGAPIQEVYNARYLLKLFIFRSSNITSEQLYQINIISQNSRVNLSLYCYKFRKEIEEIKSDILSSNCTMYDIASRGFYHNKSESHNHISFEVYDSVLDRLIKGKYPLYLDFILAAICTPYFRFKFSEVCSNRENNIGILNSDTLYLISFHLSHLDMLRMIIAFSLN